MKKIIRNEEVAFRIVKGEAVMLNPIDNQIHLLNETATYIWLELEKKHDIKDLLEAICEEFEVERQAAQDDLLRYIDGLNQKGLIEIENRGSDCD